MSESPQNDERRGGPIRFVAERLAEGGTSAFAAVFNHLLRQNDWARARLLMFAGRRVSIELDAPSLGRLAPPRLAARITEEGLLDTSLGSSRSPAEGFEEHGSEAPSVDAARAGAAPFGAAEGERFDVEMHVRPSFAAAGALLGQGARGLAPYVRIEGEVMLAAALAEIAERMRWDPEEDLSRVTGDVFAHRVGRGFAAARDAMREWRTRFAGSAGRRFAAATGTLVGRDELDSLRTSLDALEARLASVEAQRRRTLAQAGGEPARVDPAVPPQLMPPLELPPFDPDADPSRSESASGAESGASDAARRSDAGTSGPGLG